MPRDFGDLWPRLWASLRGAAIFSLTLASVTGAAAAQSRDAHLSALRSHTPSDARRSGDVERHAMRMLQEARASLDGGNSLDGRRRLEILVASYPDTGVADEARLYLSRLYAEPARNAARLGSVRPGPDLTPASVGTADTRFGPQPRNEQTRFAVTAEWDFRIAAGDRVFFGDGGVELGSSARTVLGAQARWLKQNPETLIVIEGHADDPGTDGSNADIALRRAQAVRARLVDLGVDGARIVVETRGRLHPVARCGGVDCAAQNRRVVTRLSPARTPLAIPARQSRSGVPGGN